MDKMGAGWIYHTIKYKDTEYQLAWKHKLTNYNRSCMFPGWEPNTFAVMDDLLTANTTLIDIGASIGAVAFYANQKCSRVVALEGNPRLSKYLEAGAQLNNARNVKIVSQRMSVDDMIKLGYFSGTCLVKIVVETGTEYVFKDVMEFCFGRNIPMYVTLCFSRLNTKARQDVLRWGFNTFPECMARLQLQRSRPSASALFVNTHIPVYIIGFNNPTYVLMMTKQLDKLLPRPIIHVVDNASEYPPMIALLKDLQATRMAQVHYMDSNYGHKVLDRLNLTGVYAITDPDLLFAPDIPLNMLHHLYAITISHNVRRAGLALDLSDRQRFKTFNHGYTLGEQIYDWEKKFWEFPVADAMYELYDADIDTTFHLINTNISNSKCMRVASTFTCKHLPWYVDPEVAVPAAEQEYYRRFQKCSTTSTAERAHIS